MKLFVFIFLPVFFVSICNAQHLPGDKTTMKEYNKILKTAERATRDFTNLPSSWSLKKYSPVPGDQGPYGTCVAWSSAYAARTISYTVRRKMSIIDSINQYVFSPGYLYYKIKKPDDNNCLKGANILQAMYVMNYTGIMLKKEGLSDCTVAVSTTTEIEKATPFKIKDYLTLVDSFGVVTKNDILKMKKSLIENKPVVISIKCYNSLSDVPSSGLWTTIVNDSIRGNHAMCAVGYDDTKQGGAFEIMNSWGTKWGNNGFFWLTYAQMMAYGNYAVELMDFEFEKPAISGNIEFISLEGTSMPVTRTKINTRNIIVEDDNKADYSLYKFTKIYPGGTAFKMKFSTNAPAYVYIFAQDDKGILSRLFPYNRTVSAAINSANATYFFPSETKHARLSNTPGKEDICVLYSKSDIDFEGLLKYISDTRNSIYQAVKDKLPARLLDLKNVKFKDDKISFEAPADDRSVLCFFIELDHN